MATFPTSPGAGGVLAAEYADYVRRVYPGPLTPIQAQEVKRAFFAGASCMLVRTLEASGMDPGDAEARIEWLRHEIEAFLVTVPGRHTN